MVLFFVHHESIHRVGSPPTYRAQLRPWYSNLFEKGERNAISWCKAFPSGWSTVRQQPRSLQSWWRAANSSYMLINILWIKKPAHRLAFIQSRPTRTYPGRDLFMHPQYSLWKCFLKTANKHLSCSHPLSFARWKVHVGNFFWRAGASSHWEVRTSVH